MAVKVTNLDRKALINCCKTSMSSKIIGTESGFFAKMVVDAVMRVKIMVNGKPKYPIGAINIVKCHG